MKRYRDDDIDPDEYREMKYRIAERKYIAQGSQETASGVPISLSHRKHLNENNLNKGE